MMPGTGVFRIAAIAIALATALPATFSGARAADPESLWEDAQSALQAGRLDDAREKFQLLAEEFPRSPHAPAALLELARITQDPDSSRALLDRVTRDFAHTPEAGEALVSMAQADYAMGLYEQLLEELRPATGGRYPPEVRRRALLITADAEMQSARVSRAGDDYKKVRDLSPTPLEDERALLGLAAVARSGGDLGEESRQLAVAARDHPDGDLAAVVLWQWARSLQEQGLPDAARAKMQELVDRFPATPEGGAARDALAAQGEEPEEELPKVITEHGAELTLWDDSGSDSGGAATGGAKGAARVVGDTTGGRAPAEGGPFRVLAGHFTSWEAADSLRARLVGATRESLDVAPGREGPGPFSVESGVFQDRGAAETFATWLESQSGFVSWVAKSEEAAGDGDGERP